MSNIHFKNAENGLFFLHVTSIRNQKPEKGYVNKSPEHNWLTCPGI